MEKQILVRLDPDVYRELERSLTPPVVTDATSELMAGFKLGVQTVLQKLREGYVVAK